LVTQKRQRQRDSRQRIVAMQQQARKRREQRKKLIVVVFTAVLLVLGVSVFVGSGNGGNQKVASTDSTTTLVTRKPVSLTSVPPGASITGDTPCPDPNGNSPRTLTFAKPPPTCISPSRTYTAEIVTTKGKITIALDSKGAPKTVNNFVVLARYHFYDGIPFHRIIPGFVVQVGDPQATGSGGPGYKFDDELPKAGSYKVGSVAMANSGPNTNGSQFFIITGDAGVSLSPSFSLFGMVAEGMDVVRAIEAVGTPETATDPGGEPTEVVTISSVNIKEA
jgi:peptidylprolyl isomerase/peptidyl-prolyl cis-trans isomerase B (cyclophilin B)